MTKSLYAILNIAPDADPAVVEAAYKALIKKYHPDVYAEPHVGRRRAAEINEAFQTLKDPRRRAEYDQRSRQEILRLSLAAAEARKFYGPPAPPRRARSNWASLLTLAAAGALLLFIWRESDGSMSGHPSLPSTASEREQLTDLAPVDRDSVNRAVDASMRIRNESGLIGLSAYSQACFSDQSISTRTSDFDHCVAFDQAASTYKFSTPEDRHLPYLPRFQSGEMALRHAAAGRMLSSEGSLIEQRLWELGTLTNARLEQLTLANQMRLPEPPVARPRPDEPTRKTAAGAEKPVPAPETDSANQGPPVIWPDDGFIEQESFTY